MPTLDAVKENAVALALAAGALGVLAIVAVVVVELARALL